MDMKECRKRVQAIDEQMLYLTSHGVTAYMKQDVTTYIRHYNLDRNHAANGELSPVRYEQMAEKKVSCLT